MRKVEEVNINGVSLKSLLEEHELWLNSDNTKGKRLELIKADLDYVDFSGLKLDHAIFRGSSLIGADFFSDSWEHHAEVIITDCSKKLKINGILVIGEEDE